MNILPDVSSHFHDDFLFSTLFTHHVGIITLQAISRFFFPLSGLIVLAVLREFPKYSSPCQENILAQRKDGIEYLYTFEFRMPDFHFIGVAETVTVLCKTEHALCMEMEFHLLYQIINLLFIIVDTDPL